MAIENNNKAEKTKNKMSKSSAFHPVTDKGYMYTVIKPQIVALSVTVFVLYVLVTTD